MRATQASTGKVLLAVLAVLLLVGACSSTTGGAPAAATRDATGSAPVSASAPLAAPASGLTAGSAPTALIVDASGSMLIEDTPGQRMAAAKGAAKALVDTLPDGAKLALLTYGTGTGNSAAEFDAGCRDVTVVRKLGALDKAGAAAQIEALVPSGYTPIGAALRKAAQELPGTGPAAIILVSDGEDMCSPPPCDVAAELHGANPQLAISAVGFRADGLAADQLSCIANATGGIFVTAENAAQLGARLSAAADLPSARKALTATGRGGVEIGEYYDEISARTPDFPPFAGGAKRTVDGADRIVIRWLDCDWIFTPAGELVAIDPGPGAQTIDGVRAGMTISEATTRLGQPVTVPQAAARTRVFAADERAGTAWRMEVDADGDRGKITAIMLCLCLPGSAADVPNQVAAAPGGTLLSAGEIETSGVCGNLCSVQGFADVDHPSWGRSRVFMTEIRTTTSRSAPGPKTFGLMAIDTDGRVRWRSELPGPITAGEAMRPVKDSTDNIFFETTHNGASNVIVLRPTMRGFEHFGSLAESGGGRFAGYTRELGAGGLYEFRPTGGGATYQWNGSTYAPK